MAMICMWKSTNMDGRPRAPLGPGSPKSIQSKVRAARPPDGVSVGVGVMAGTGHRIDSYRDVYHCPDGDNLEVNGETSHCLLGCRREGFQGAANHRTPQVPEPTHGVLAETEEGSRPGCGG